MRWFWVDPNPGSRRLSSILVQLDRMITSLHRTLSTWLLFAALRTAAQATENHPPLTDGTVDAIAVSGGTTYIGGKFTKVGEDTGSAVVFDATTGATAAGWPYVNGPVKTAIPDSAGGFYIGGQFSTVGGVTRHRVAHLLADKTVDASFDPDVAPTYTYIYDYLGPEYTYVGVSSVHSLLLDGSTLYIGGLFKQVNGSVDRWGLAAVNATSGVALAFDPHTEQTDNGGFTAVPGEVDCLAINGNTLYFGGHFTAVNSGSAQQTRIVAAAVDKTSAVLTAFNPNGSAQPSVDGVNEMLAPRAMAVAGSNLFAGGTSRSSSGSNYIGGQARPAGMAKLDLTTGAVSSWNPNLGVSYGGVANSFVIVGSTIYVGGATNGYPALWSVNSVSGVVGSWTPPVRNSSVVTSVNLVGNSLYVAGQFFGANDDVVYGVDAFDISTGQQAAWKPDRAFDSYFGGSAQRFDTLCISGGVVFVGGEISVFDTVPRYKLAAFDTATGTPLAWAPNVFKADQGYADLPEDAEVFCLTVQNGAVYAGGDFLKANLPFSTVDGRQYYSGGTIRNHAAAFDATTGTVTAWDPNADSIVRSLVGLGSTIYAAGDFSGVNNEAVQRTSLAAFDASSGSATAWNPAPDDLAHVVATDGTFIYAGGYFSSVGNGAVARRGLAAFDPNGGAATSWNPGVAVSSSTGVLALAIDGSTLYAGGQFSGDGSVNGTVRRNYAAAFDLGSGAATAFNPDLDGPVDALAVNAGIVYLGGTFQSANVTRGPFVRRLLAAVNAADGTLTTFDPESSYDAFRANGGIKALAVGGSQVFAAGTYGFFGTDAPASAQQSADLDPALYRPGFAAYGFSSADVATLPTPPVTNPGFFDGQTALSNGVYYLQFPNGNIFGYYSYLTDPHYVYHFDLGYEYVFDAADGKGGVYFYDFASQTFFYTSPAFPFPYLYDFTLNTVLYYYPDPNNAGHYNTDGYRFFYRFDTRQIIVK